MKEHDVVFHEKTGRAGAIVAISDEHQSIDVEFLDGPIETLRRDELVLWDGQRRRAPDKSRVVEQPPDDVQVVTADDVFIKSMCVRSAGTLIPQHAHRYDHTSALVAGSIRAWCDGKHIGDFHAPKLLLIKAGTKHKFLSLSDHTIILCIHNAMRPDVAAVVDEHILEDRR